MKTFLFSLFLFLSLCFFSQKLTIMVSSFEYSTMEGDVPYQDLLFKSQTKFKNKVNQNFIIDFKEMLITTVDGKYKVIDSILRLDTLSNGLFELKYKEGSKNPSSNKYITLILDTNLEKRKIIQSFYDSDDNFSLLKVSKKDDLIMLTTN